MLTGESGFSISDTEVQPALLPSGVDRLINLLKFYVTEEEKKDIVIEKLALKFQTNIDSYQYITPDCWLTGS